MLTWGLAESAARGPTGSRENAENSEEKNPEKKTNELRHGFREPERHIIYGADGKDEIGNWSTE